MIPLGLKIILWAGDQLNINFIKKHKPTFKEFYENPPTPKKQKTRA